MKESLAIESRDKARFAAQLATDKKAEDLVILDLRKLTNFCDYFVIASGNSQRQVEAIADAIEEGFLGKKIKRLGINGARNGMWALLDYGDVVIHIFDKTTRSFYDLERLWVEAPKVRVSTVSTD